MNKKDFLTSFKVNGREYHYYKLAGLDFPGYNLKKLPFSIRVLVENILRKLDGSVVKKEHLQDIACWKGKYEEPVDIPYFPARVLMQDFTGVPAVVDLAALRDAVKAQSKDPALINPMVPVDLIVDHSVQVDYYGAADALQKNVEKEYRRNKERYSLLKWAQDYFSDFNIVPPNSGICHQVNLEHLSKVVITKEAQGKLIAFPDTLVGTDSHTTMINGIGVLGWGVGGIEAEAVLLGQPYFMSIPEVIGVKLTGKLQPGVTTTDLVLTITELLRKQKVVEKFVEYFGPGYKALSVPERATLSNMSPEYGATMGFCPVDEKTLAYLKQTGREKEAALTETYTRANNLFYTGEEEPRYTEVLEFDLDTVEPSLAGPVRPQDRVSLSGMKESFQSIIADRNAFSSPGAGGSAEKSPVKRSAVVNIDGQEVILADGSVVIAAITSCTNTSNPFVMLGAGLLAKKAVEKGLRVPVYVKTSLAPGSKVVIDYLENAGLMPYFEALGFHLTAFGCTTCIGNSGPLRPKIEKAIVDNRLTAAAVLSGNRNFEARIHQDVRANFLASPMLVVAFALSGRMDLDLTTEPIGLSQQGEDIFLKDIWPENTEIETFTEKFVDRKFFEKQYAGIFSGDEYWQRLPVTRSAVFDWQEDSTYIKKPPFFEGFSPAVKETADIENARVLLLLSDSVTTDHISPAGGIPADYPAGKYLIQRRVKPVDFNSYGSRRGNYEVMMRGTFANVRIKNRLVAPREGGFTCKFPQSEESYVFDAAERYASEGVPLIVLGGKEYGTGSSRDWAAKGTLLLGVKAVIAESFERIHRSNLVGMGVLPLVFRAGESIESLGLDGSEVYSISGISGMEPRRVLSVKAVKADGTEIEFEVIARLDNEVEVEYFESGGILPYVLKKVLTESAG